MGKYILIIILILSLCTIPFNAFAENKATDAGSVVFDIGSAAYVAIYTSGYFEGDNQLTEFRIGSGQTY